MQSSSQIDYLVITQAQQQQTIEQIGILLKERLSLQQSLANQSTTNIAANEQLFLELLEIFDALESLIDYFKNNAQLTEKAIARLPKSLNTINSKLLAILAKKQVKVIAATDTEPDWNLYQIVDTQINPQITTPTVTKVVRQGFKIGKQLLRPVEVIIEKPKAIS